MKKNPMCMFYCAIIRLNNLSLFCFYVLLDELKLDCVNISALLFFYFFLK